MRASVSFVFVCCSKEYLGIGTVPSLLPVILEVMMKYRAVVFIAKSLGNLAAQLSDNLTSIS
jgi:hypothetical protein